tara:strand:+ start:294 stop:1361 length:1068 start_codon:yes stop_codon:yes gene_type:complete
MLERIKNIKERFAEVELSLSNPEISKQLDKMETLGREHAALRPIIDLGQRYKTTFKDLNDAQQMVKEEDQEVVAFAKDQISELSQQLTELESDLTLALLPKDPNDMKNVIIEIRAGTGGDEAGLFAADLYRMYFRYAQIKKWKVDILSGNQTGIGSIKEIVFLIKGENVYSSLKHEGGTHRVQRVPLTESSGRIHTSAATVVVMPEAEEVEVDIKPEDIKIDIFHSSGHGGQNVQKVATAVRITHKSSGLVVVCSDERSQFQNKEKAMAVLRARILAMETEKNEREIALERKSQVGSGDRSGRVRTYNFPQNRVTDHRINLTLHGLDEILDGSIDDFVVGLQDEERNIKLNNLEK